MNAVSEVGLSRQALMTGFLATAIIGGCASSTRLFALAPPAMPAEPSAGQTARNMSLDSQQRPPGALIVSQIHNAPGWRSSHTYTYTTGPYTRVVSGPGWNPANDSYNPGQTLNAYQLTSTGTCTSASGGGPRGTEASIKDGTCVWKYLSPVDYISITGWAFDSALWKAATYAYRARVVSDTPLRSYMLMNVDRCVSTVAPTGITASFTTSDGCQWQYNADVIYTSRASFIPAQSVVQSPGQIIVNMRANYRALLWNDREYVAGANGEANPIRVQDHDDHVAEGWGELRLAGTPPYHIIVEAAPGESFSDSLKSTDPLTGYDPTRGVAIRNDLPFNFPFDAAGIEVHDNYTDLIGLQIKSTHGAAVNGITSFANAMTVRHCILDGGSDTDSSGAAFTTDTASFVANTLIIARGSFGAIHKYPGVIEHSTIVAPNRTANSIAIINGNVWVYDPMIVWNTAIFGFAHAGAWQLAGTTFSASSSGNVTDAPNDLGVNGNYTVAPIPGTIYGASMSTAFVSPGTDWRPKAGGSLIGGGGPLGNHVINTIVWALYGPSPSYNFDGADIIGTARPQNGLYDIGAWQTPFGGQPTQSRERRHSQGTIINPN